MNTLSTSRSLSQSPRTFCPTLSPASFCRLRVASVARVGSRGDGAVLDRPGLLTGGQGIDPKTENGWGASQGDNNKGRGGGHHRVLLLDSERHTEQLVVNAILTTIPGTDKDHASNCFHTSRSLGMAIITSALLEIAEFYQQQLYRQGVKASIEPDTTTI